MKITIDLKRGIDADKFMTKLYKMTPLQDSFSCNFNVLIKGRPVVLGVRDILLEWVDFRLECIRRRITFNLNKKKNQLHLLKGLSKILLDIDKAIKIVRETESESEVVPNLMIGFGIDEIQAEYVAEIKLRHLNREYILKRIKDIEQLENDIVELESILSSKNKMKKIIIKELEDVTKKYDNGRKSEILYSIDESVEEELVEIPDYPVTLFITEHGYFKKIKTANLRMSGEQKLKRAIHFFLKSNVQIRMNFFSLQISARCIKQKLMILLIQKLLFSVSMFRVSLKWQRVNRWFTLLL